MSCPSPGAEPDGVTDIPQRAMQLHYLLGAGRLVQAVDVLQTGRGEKHVGYVLCCSDCIWDAICMPCGMRHLVLAGLRTAVRAQHGMMQPLLDCAAHCHRSMTAPW